MATYNLALGGRGQVVYPYPEGMRLYTKPYPRKVDAKDMHNAFTQKMLFWPADLVTQQAVAMEAQTGDYIILGYIPERHSIQELSVTTNPTAAPSDNMTQYCPGMTMEGMTVTFDIAVFTYDQDVTVDTPVRIITLTPTNGGTMTAIDLVTSQVIDGATVLVPSDNRAIVAPTDSYLKLGEIGVVRMLLDSPPTSTAGDATPYYGYTGSIKVAVLTRSHSMADR